MWRRKPSYRIRGKTLIHKGITNGWNRLIMARVFVRALLDSIRNILRAQGHSFLPALAFFCETVSLFFVLWFILAREFTAEFPYDRSISSFRGQLKVCSIFIYCLFRFHFRSFVLCCGFVFWLCEMNWIWIIYKFRAVRWEMTISWEIEIFGFNYNCGKIRF